MPLPKHPNVGAQEKLLYSYEHKSDGIAATGGSITCLAKASMADTDVMTIADGVQPVKTYEFDVAGDGVAAGNVQVDISGDTSAADCAATLVAAIQATQPLVAVTDNLDGTIAIAARDKGAPGNQIAMTETVANAGFLVTNPSGGAGHGDAHNVTATRKLFTARRRFRVDKVEYVNPTGLAGHASNFWDLEFKKGSTVVASWSTDSAAEGTIAADTFVNFTLSATDTNLVVNAGDVLSLVLTKNASAADLPPGRLVVHGRFV